MHETLIHQFHIDQGAQMVDFAGWHMPMRYGSIVEEHHQVRNSGGMFDVSHMGRLQLSGLHAKRLLERVCSRRIGDMQAGQCRYTLMCNERGGVMDDVIVYRFDEDDFLVVVNASNREKIVAHIESVIAERGFKVEFADNTFKTAMLAAQGPRVIDLISKVSKEIPSLKRYRFTVKNLMVIKLIVSRTGYTGEDGVEVILPAKTVGMAMKLLMKDIDPKDPEAPMKPAGLGCRDTLRIEAGMPLYGHELGEEINALSCGVNFAISLDKTQEADGETFVGQEALLKIRDSGGPETKLIGLRLDGKRTARQGMSVLAGDRVVGTVSSGCLSPTLGVSIAMAFVERAAAEDPAGLRVDFGRQQIDATAVDLPFYKRAK